MGDHGNRKKKNPDWQLTLTGNIIHSSVDHPKGQSSPMGTNAKAPDWQLSLAGIEGKEKLGEVLGSQIGGHTQWGIRATEKKRIQIGSLPQRGIIYRAVWRIQRGSHPQWGLMLRRHITSHPRRGYRERRSWGKCWQARLEATPDGASGKQKIK